MDKIEDIVTQQGGMISLHGRSHENTYRRIVRAKKNGKLVRVRKGVYALPYAFMDAMIDVESVVPGGVVCLYNAWAFYGLTMQNPPTFCIAVDAKRKIVFAQKQMITLYYWNEQSLTLGVEEVEYSSHKVRMTNAERSVCDAVRYRNKIGEDLCLEIIRTYLKRPDRKIGIMMEYAKALRVAKILGNYLNILME
jgi:predicted transcriptional regulator of viral defense system